MTLKITNIRRHYIAPYAEMIVCDSDECVLDTVSAIGENPGGNGGNEEFAKGMGGIWDEGSYAGGSDGFNNIFGDEP